MKVMQVEKKNVQQNISENKVSYVSYSNKKGKKLQPKILERIYMKKVIADISHKIITKTTTSKKGRETCNKMRSKKLQ